MYKYLFWKIQSLHVISVQINHKSGIVWLPTHFFPDPWASIVSTAMLSEIGLVSSHMNTMDVVCYISMLGSDLQRQLVELIYSFAAWFACVRNSSEIQ